ncbi:DUF4276 family protein [Bradyrhizobium sp. HKCCYLRH2015]|uniref:DUF4276 family protein n=1 Tax=Bradyrhizobium sp. HKCCYLRH2015 TaxID=3420742 RepID=UPI003EB96E62
MYEGPTDKAYFETLIPRAMEELTRLHGLRQTNIPQSAAILLRRADNNSVAEQVCREKQAFHLVFIHADTGGRNLEANIDDRSTRICEVMNTICNWPPERCIPLAPRKETEAWALCDPSAVMDALGYAGTPNSIGLPADAGGAEALPDPKATLNAAVRAVRGRRRGVQAEQLLVAIAQRQDLGALRASPSFRQFEARLRQALANLGCIEPN